MQSTKSAMLKFSDDASHVAYRKLHKLKLDSFPTIHTIIRIAWAATSLGFVTALVKSSNDNIQIPLSLSIGFAVLILFAAHYLLDVTYRSALRERFADIPKAYLSFVFPAIIAFVLYLADYQGSRALINNFTYKAKTSTLNEGIYSSRVADSRNVFSRDSAMQFNQIEGIMKSKISGNRAEIARLQRRPTKSQSDVAWVQKLITAELSEISRIEAKYKQKQYSAINAAATNRDTTLSAIYAERNGEQKQVSHSNILETDKEMEGNRSATSSGSIIALFFLIAYAVLTWQIELINFKGGIEEDTTPTFLDKYKGRFGYLFAALNNIFDVKFIDFVNILFKKAGVENKVQEIIEIKSSQILRTTTTFPIATAERKPIGFFMEAVPSSAELVRTPVQAVQEDIQPVQNNIQTHIQDIKGVHTANYVLDKKEVVARLKLAKQSVMVNIRFLNRGERETPTTYQNIENTIPNVMKLLDETNDEATILDIQIWRRELEETLLNNAGYQAWKMIKEVQNAA